MIYARFRAVIGWFDLPARRRYVIVAAALSVAVIGVLLARSNIIARSNAAGVASNFALSNPLKSLIESAAEVLPATVVWQDKETNSSLGNSDSGMVETHLNYETGFRCEQNGTPLQCSADAIVLFLRTLRERLEERAKSEGMTVRISREITDEAHHKGFLVEYVRPGLHGTINARILSGPWQIDSTKPVELKVFLHEFARPGL